MVLNFNKIKKMAFPVNLYLKQYLKSITVKEEKKIASRFRLNHLNEDIYN